MTLHEMFRKLMEEYVDEQTEANTKKAFKRPFSRLVRHDIVDFLKQQIDQNIYLVEGSVGGKPMWTNVPWIAIYDKRITKSAQQGVYIVYLLNKDSKELYLTFNQGATTIVQGGVEKPKFTGMSDSISKKAIATLKENAESIRTKIGNVDNLCSGEINTGKKAYDAGCIYYIKYTTDNLPNDKKLCSDLLMFISVYQKYYQCYFSGENDWWPSTDEYNPGLSKEQWVEYLKAQSEFTSEQLDALAKLYSYGDSATMAELENEFGGSSDAYRNRITSLGEKAVKHFNVPACNKPGAKYWPCMYFGKSVGKNRHGNYAYKIRPELREALLEINIMQYLIKDEAELRFHLPEGFKDRLSRRFVNSLLAKPFVILTGNSGTGKTRIATRFAQLMERNVDGEKNCEFVPVGADWTDNTAILGYFNPMGNDGMGQYVDTAILRLIERALRYPKYPFFLILDEMNLSHVERYFSDFLSHMETPETKFKIEGYSDKEFTYPDNLFVIGTVNIDETTYMFSPKVLDRANVIEFKPEKDDVIKLFEEQSFEDNVENADDKTITEFMLLARSLREKSWNFDMTDAKKVFSDVYDVLAENDFEFAFRTVKEICLYFYASTVLDDGSTRDINEIIDEQVVQKLLPKIYGNKRSIGDMLEKLNKIFTKDYKLRLSAEKLSRMRRNLEHTQYVSFI